jgi:hypothetical protein
LTASGRCPPEGDKKARAAEKAFRKYVAAEGAVLNLGSLRNKQAKAVAGLEKAVTDADTPDERTEAEASLAEAKAQLEGDEQAYQEAAQDVEDTMAKATKAEDALKTCRKKHPCPGRCGKKGGVGIPRPSGKCAGWRDWVDKNGNYY